MAPAFVLALALGLVVPAPAAGDSGTASATRITSATAAPAATATTATTGEPAITVDVVVEDARGRSVDTLTSADFSVAEQAVALPVESVRFVRPAPFLPGSPVDGIAPETAITETSRLFAVFLDEFHVAPGPGAERARLALAQFVREGLGPHDWLVVLKPLQSLLDITLTNDREAAARAIESFDPRRGDLTPKTAFERNFIAGEAARVEAARAQISASSLQALATQLSRFSPARKTLIVVSEGFARSGRRWSGDLLPNTDSIALAANRAHVSIYTIDPAPRDPAPRDAAARAAPAGAPVDPPVSEALRSLAERTSGRVLTAGDDLGGSLARALSDASGYYALTVSAASARDGKFHPVAVAVRGSGLAVRARAGYWSALPPETHAPAGGTLSFAAQFARRTSPLVRPWFGMTRGANGATRVNFVWEPVPSITGARGMSATAVRVALTVTTLDGAPVFDGIVLPSQGSGDDPARARQSFASFESPADRLLVRMAIEDAGSRVVDRDVRDLVVGRFTGPVAIGSIAVLRARNAREFRTIAADPSSPPASSREFSRAERLLVRVPVFAADGAPAVAARLLGPGGQTMRMLTATAAPSSLALYQVDVPLAGLAAGSYTVEFTVRSSDGEAKESLPFRVTP